MFPKRGLATSTEGVIPKIQALQWTERLPKALAFYALKTHDEDLQQNQEKSQKIIMLTSKF